MPAPVHGLLADANCLGHLAVLIPLLHSGWRREVWETLHLTLVTFADLGLQADASDRAVWDACQQAHVVLLTANRNDNGPDSLEATLQQHNTPASLPIFTFTNDQRVFRDRGYAEAVADRLLEFLFDIDQYRGTGRLYVPSCGGLLSAIKVHPVPSALPLALGVHSNKEGMHSMNNVVVITGGSRGIGAATARLAASRGYAVCVSYVHNQPAANAVVSEITAHGGRALAVAADVAVEADVVRLFHTVDTHFGTLTALVNNAGILETQMRVEAMDAARLQRIFAVNITGCFLCAREAVKRMSRRHGGQGGVIVNVSSAASRLGSAGEYVDYAASKGAVDTLTIGLAREVAAEGIRVNAVRPACIDTDIHARGGEPGRVDRLKHAIPMHRGGQPEEVAQAILWLLSDEASYTTGSFLDLAGGL